jgi:hypothetical protein
MQSLDMAEYTGKSSIANHGPFSYATSNVRIRRLPIIVRPILASTYARQDKNPENRGHDLDNVQQCLGIAYQTLHQNNRSLVLISALCGCLLL